MVLDGLDCGQFRKQQAAVSCDHHLFEAVCVQTTAQMQHRLLCTAQVHARDDSGDLDFSRQNLLAPILLRPIRRDDSQLKSHIHFL